MKIAFYSGWTAVSVAITAAVHTAVVRSDIHALDASAGGPLPFVFWQFQLFPHKFPRQKGINAGGVGDPKAG